MKRILLGAAIVFASTLTAQTVFVNEIHYDNASTDVDEGIEIAGPAGTDLTGYTIELYNGGTSDIYGSIQNLTGTIPNQQNGYGTINFPISGLQNGSPDGFALIDPSNNVIQFLSYEGVITALGGTANGMTSTDIGIAETGSTVVGESLQLTGVGIVYTDFTWTAQTQTRDAVNTNQVFGTPVPVVSFANATMNIGEAAGTISIDLTISNADANPTSVDVSLNTGSSTATDVSDFTFTGTTVTFAGGSSTNETITLTIVDDAITEANEDIVLDLSNPTNSAMIGTGTITITINDNDIAPITPCSEIFFSEYIESSGSKALEIYNPTTSIVNLSQYEIRRYNNGSTNPTSTLSLAGNLIPGDVYVICNSTADAAIQAQADLLSGITGFNGDDAIELFNQNSGTAVDIIGEIGVDPGTSWHVGTDSTENVTMVRMASVDAGNLLWTGGSDQEWNTYGLNEYSFIGSHTNTGCSEPALPVAYPIGGNNFCVGDTIIYTHNSFGGTEPYSVQWTIGGIPASTSDTVSYEAVGATTLSITLTITDNNSIVDDSTFNITINDIPSAGFTMPAYTMCAEDTLDITSTGTGTGILVYSYSSTPLATLSTGGGSGNGYFTTATDGSYTITQTLTDFNGCIDTAMHSVTVNVKDDGSFSALPDLCDDETLSLVHTDNTGTWSGTGVTDNGSGLGEFASTTTGDNYITYTTSGTCPDVYTDTVVVFASPVASFTYTGGVTVDFIDASTGTPTIYGWDFGDGNTASTANATHTYTADGTYTVCLSVENADGCNDTICQSVSVAGVGVTELENSSSSFYPNPTSNELNINTNDPVQVTIFNLIGEMVFNERIGSNKIISLGYLESGSYFIQFDNSSQKRTEKLIIK